MKCTLLQYKYVNNTRGHPSLPRFKTTLALRSQRVPAYQDDTTTAFASTSSLSTSATKWGGTSSTISFPMNFPDGGSQSGSRVHTMDSNKQYVHIFESKVIVPSKMYNRLRTQPPTNKICNEYRSGVTNMHAPIAQKPIPAYTNNTGKSTPPHRIVGYMSWAARVPGGASQSFEHP